MNSVMMLQLVLLPLTLLGPGPADLKLAYSKARLISYKLLVMEAPYDRYSGGPFISWSVSTDGSRLFWANNSVGQLAGQNRRQDILVEMRVRDKPIPMISPHFNKIFERSTTAKSSPSGEAAAIAVFDADGSRAKVLHVSIEAKWRKPVTEMWGVSEIETDAHKSPLQYDPLFFVSAPSRIIASAADASSRNHVLVAVQRDARNGRAALLSFATSGHSATRARRTAAIKMSVQYPRLLVDSKQRLIVSFDDEANITFTDAVSGRQLATSHLPERSRKLFEPINITWHPNGGVLVTLRQSADPQRNLQLWLLDVKTKRWTYLGPWGALGASRTGNWQLFASPLDPKQCWLLKLKG